MRRFIWISYWIFLFIVMHTPVLAPGGMRLGNADKVAHFMLYALLTWLGARQFAGVGRNPKVGLLLFWAGVYCVYGAVDEYLQQFVGRTTDLGDWLADALGVAAATAFLAARSRKLSEPAGRL